MRTILADVDGWTPAIDHITREYGVTVSVVFGRMWRYTNGENQACTASIDTIAAELGLNRDTVIEAIKKLVASGYLKDLTTGLRNRPHVYVDTGKAGLTMRIGVINSDSKQASGVGNSDTRSKKGVGNSDSAVGNSDSKTGFGVGNSVTGVGNSDLKKEFKKEEGEERIKENGAISQNFDAAPVDKDFRDFTWAINCLRTEVSWVYFRDYVGQCKLASVENGTFVVCCENDKAREWMEGRTTQILENKLLALLGRPARVKFVVMEEAAVC